MSQSETVSDTRRVVVLVTRASHGKRCDARVAVMSDPTLLTKEADHPSVQMGAFNRASALENFGDARVRSKDEALREANRIAQERGLTVKTPFMLVCEHVNFPSKPRPGVRGASRHSSASDSSTGT